MMPSSHLRPLDDDARRVQLGVRRLDRVGQLVEARGHDRTRLARGGCSVTSQKYIQRADDTFVLTDESARLLERGVLGVGGFELRIGRRAGVAEGDRVIERRRARPDAPDIAPRCVPRYEVRHISMRDLGERSRRAISRARSRRELERDLACWY